MNYYMCIYRLMCKNLEYISLLQLRAILAEPSKMHRNRPLAVYPATLVPLREGACPEYKSSKSPPYNCQKTTICSLICVDKSLLRLQTVASLAHITRILRCLLTNDSCFCFIPEPTNRIRNFVDYRVKTPVLRIHIRSN